MAKEPNTKRIDTIVGKDTALKGNVEAEGAIRVDGRFEGEITTGGDLVIGEGGYVQGTIVAKDITVGGHLDGKVEARGKLELLPTAHVQGEIRMALIVVEEGAFLQGNCEVMPRGGDIKERGKNLQAETKPVFKKPQEEIKK